MAQPSSTLRSLIRLASPSLPVGGLSHAEGLEAAVDAGRLHDESGAGDWLLQHLELAHGRADAPAVARAAALAAVAAQAPAALVMADLKTHEDLDEVVRFIEARGLLAA